MMICLDVDKVTGCDNTGVVFGCDDHITGCDKSTGDVKNSEPSTGCDNALLDVNSILYNLPNKDER